LKQGCSKVHNPLTDAFNLPLHVRAWVLNIAQMRWHLSALLILLSAILASNTVRAAQQHCKGQNFVVQDGALKGRTISTSPVACGEGLTILATPSGTRLVCVVPTYCMCGGAISASIHACHDEKTGQIVDLKNWSAP